MIPLQTVLDPTLSSPEVRDFEGGLRRRVVGQDRAVRTLARAYQVFVDGCFRHGSLHGTQLAKRVRFKSRWGGGLRGRRIL